MLLLSHQIQLHHYLTEKDLSMITFLHLNPILFFDFIVFVITYIIIIDEMRQFHQLEAILYLLSIGLLLYLVDKPVLILMSIGLSLLAFFIITIKFNVVNKIKDLFAPKFNTKDLLISNLLFSLPFPCSR